MPPEAAKCPEGAAWLVAAPPPRVVLGFDGDVAQAPRGTETPPEVRLEEKAVGVGQPGAAAPREQGAVTSQSSLEALPVCVPALPHAVARSDHAGGGLPTVAHWGERTASRLPTQPPGSHLERETGLGRAKGQVSSQQQASPAPFFPESGVGGASPGLL